ncbi:transmembrane protease serine 9-like [Centruroides sculpturatus]|uniref:transmembrane protease serine 9-like n=1 Tax=Centruroides sculpturatus TaxID=218467 RepID=UPI000C6DA840|nr:transmembrane protease serine 9-like [Centruroides sculpturatus]
MIKFLWFLFMQFFLIDILAQELCNDNEAKCGLQFLNDEKVVGGEDAKEGEVPWMAMLSFHGEFVCGASIIDVNWALSAAHCFAYSKKPEDYHLTIGTINRYGIGGVNVTLEKIIIHENYENLTNDIALLKTETIELNNNIQPIQLSTKKADSGTLATVSGFGTIFESAILFKEKLQLANLTILSNEECQQWFNEMNVSVGIKESHLCAGDRKGGKGACFGDSGGPLYIKHNNGVDSQYGVVSFGAGCARPNLPGVYANVSFFNDWIEENFFLIAVFFLIEYSMQEADFENGTPCGRQFVRNGKIVGGRNAEEGEVPWIASIYLRGIYSCVGSIIAKRWILTAAHCFMSTSKPRNYYIRVGNLYMNGQGNDLDIESIYKHPNYRNPRRYNNDIALLKLKNDIVYNKYTWPICLDRNNVSLNDKIATIAGWGKLEEGGAYHPEILQLVRLPIVNNEMCQQWFRNNGKKWVIVEDNQICAGYEEGGKDACQGDSGGPQYIKQGNSHILIGVVSSGIGCARPQTPGLYTRVSSYISWIDETIKNNS